MPTRHGTSRTALGWTCACTSLTTMADLERKKTGGRVHDERQVCCLPGHLCLLCSTGLAGRQRPPGSSHLDGPPSLPDKAAARGPPSLELPQIADRAHCHFAVPPRRCPEQAPDCSPGACTMRAPASSPMEGTSPLLRGKGCSTVRDGHPRVTAGVQTGFQPLARWSQELPAGLQRARGACWRAFCCC